MLWLASSYSMDESAIQEGWRNITSVLWVIVSSFSYSVVEQLSHRIECLY